MVIITGIRGFYSIVSNDSIKIIVERLKQVQKISLRIR